MSNEVESSSSSSLPSPMKKVGGRRALDMSKLIVGGGFDEEAYCPEGVERMDRECWSKYLKQIKDSEGFDITDFPGICFMTPIVPFSFEDSPSEIKLISDLAKLAIKEYNTSLKRTRYDFEKLERVNTSIAAGTMYYITFQAKERKRGAVKTFQAKVWDGMPMSNTSVKFCRLKRNVQPNQQQGE